MKPKPNAQVKGIYVQDIEVTVDGDVVFLSVWKNPETGNLTALDTMDLPERLSNSNMGHLERWSPLGRRTRRCSGRLGKRRRKLRN